SRARRGAGAGAVSLAQERRRVAAHLVGNQRQSRRLHRRSARREPVGGDQTSGWRDGTDGCPLHAGPARRDRAQGARADTTRAAGGGARRLSLVRASVSTNRATAPEPTREARPDSHAAPRTPITSASVSIAAAMSSTFRLPATAKVNAAGRFERMALRSPVVQ